MEYWIASYAAEAGRKSLTATSLFSFFLSDYYVKEQLNTINYAVQKEGMIIQYYIMSAYVHN